ncbi:DDE_3 domain-containing protein [Trichonephila clavipes]|uniref:DDE_3 domain-containing protein n=1 Tax=Trichonephila clavipes TaxID=2585209 RepID=A0A8X6SAI0_TRICX|nr:DDE_3 domain-containing protein [Trichonephila clavipes]
MLNLSNFIVLELVGYGSLKGILPTQISPSSIDLGSIVRDPSLKVHVLLQRNHQMARTVRHNDENVREGYIRNGGKEVKLFTSALKAFQCNNRIVMAQRKHLDDFYVVELLDDWKVDVPSWKYPRNL